MPKVSKYAIYSMFVIGKVISINSSLIVEASEREREINMALELSDKPWTWTAVQIHKY